MYASLLSRESMNSIDRPTLHTTEKTSTSKLVEKTSRYSCELTLPKVQHFPVSTKKNKNSSASKFTKEEVLYHTYSIQLLQFLPGGLDLVSLGLKNGKNTSSEESPQAH